MPLCGQLAVWRGGYYSVLPQGVRVSVPTMKPGRSIFDGRRETARGDDDVAIATPYLIAKLAVDRVEPVDQQLPLRAIANIPYNDRMAFAVRAETGVRSFRDFKERRYLLRVSMPLRETNHSGS